MNKFQTKRFLNLRDFEACAKARLPRAIYGYIAGGSEDGVSALANRAAFQRHTLVPRVMTDTSARTTAVRTLGKEWSAPFAIAPMGSMGVAAPSADLVMARAASRANIPFVLSGASLIPLEAVIRANEDAWFQVYLTQDEAHNDALISRVDNSGYRTLVVTADVAVAANREDDVRNGYSSPLRPTARLLFDGLSHPRWLFGTLLRTLVRDGMPHFENFGGPRSPMLARQGLRLHRRDNLNWTVLERLRERWKHRLVLKGVLAAEDVRRAREIGLDATVLSNHGGRQLDGAVSPLEVLPEVLADAGGMPLMLDSGVRRGTDVIKALALGAVHVLLGRPFLYAAVTGGQAGVEHAISLLQAEISRDLALLGRTRLDDLKGCVRRHGGFDHSGGLDGMDKGVR